MSSPRMTESSGLFEAGFCLPFIFGKVTEALVITNGQSCPSIRVLSLGSQLEPKNTASLRGKAPLQQLSGQSHLSRGIAAIGTIYQLPVDGARAAKQSHRYNKEKKSTHDGRK